MADGARIVTGRAVRCFLVSLTLTVAVLGVRSAAAAPWQEIAAAVAEGLERAATAYDANDVSAALRLAAEAYFGPFEERGMETAIRREISARRARELEKAFAEVRQAMGRGEPPAQVRGRIDGLRAMLHETATHLDDAGATATALADGAEGADGGPPAMLEGARGVAGELVRRLGEVRARYEAGDADAASAALANAYFDVFEGRGLEAAVGASGPGRKQEIEAGFGEVRRSIAARAPSAAVAQALDRLERLVEDAAATLEVRRGRWASLLNALLLIVREGTEAILVVTALVAYLVKSGHADKVGVVYRGSAAALVASVLTAAALRTLFTVSPRHQETLEGVAMLAATAVLFYVSYWLTSRAEAERWQRHVRRRLEASLGTRSLRALWFAAFLAVYREGAETVLFSHALIRGAGPDHRAAVLGGFAVGGVVLVLAFLLLRFGALSIPIRPFFTATSALLYYLAIVFAGRGIRELQESGVIPTTAATWVPTIDLIGLYPTWESVALQVVLVGAAAFAFFHLLLARGSRCSGEPARS